MARDMTLVICGQAGQGIRTVEGLLIGALKHAGFHVFSTREYMSRIRGGMNSTSLRISDRRVRCYSERIDVLIPLSRGGVAHVAGRMGSETLVLGEEKNIAEDERGKGRFVEMPWSRIAEELGEAFYANTIAAGVIAGALKCDRRTIEAYIRDAFSSKGDDVAAKNIKAIEEGYARGIALREKGAVAPRIKGGGEAARELLMSGTTAVALGALAGGCNFLSFYPMSPSTGVATFIARHADELGAVVEQAEDEIAAMNMALGAWYAGARGMVTTSGGGFALMVEGLSLSGMLETPVVIMLGQRPGPATGLPTRTEQGDLLFALFAGHGEFPRIIYAPGTIEEAFSLARQAFNAADRHQVPVFILADQYLLDSSYNLPGLDLAGGRIERRVVKTGADYSRYRLTQDGVSPRGVPGHGAGLVVLDSDEHDEDGHITEDLELRTMMVNKRLKKGKRIMEETRMPPLHGDKDFSTLVIGWGSTYHAILESLEEIGTKGVGYLHFCQVYPLPPGLGDFLRKAGKTVVVENNATSQFGRLLRMETGFRIGKSILKYSGLPFSREELTEALQKEVAS